MRRRTTPQMFLGAAAVALVAVSVVGFLDRDKRDAGTRSGRNSVHIADFSFEPEVLEASLGATVTWSNDDDFAHTVTFGTDGPTDSGDIAAGGTYQATFDDPGSFEYTCTIHPSMSGVVEVTAG